MEVAAHDHLQFGDDLQFDGSLEDVGGLLEPRQDLADVAFLDWEVVLEDDDAEVVQGTVLEDDEGVPGIAQVRELQSQLDRPVAAGPR